MTESQYRAWVADGSPFTLVRPLRHLRDVLRAHGYVVYDIGNRSHMYADPPEDHTPFSGTGWPSGARYGYGYAVDIMPPRAGSGLPPLRQLARQMHDDRSAGGIKWLKYMNWEPEGDYTGPCLHCSWQPDHVQRSSTDRGHIHVSARTGYEESSAGDGYDPVAAIRGGLEVFNADELVKALQDPRVGAWFAAAPWRYAGGGLPAGMSALAALGELLARARDDGDDPAEIAAAVVALFPVDQLAGVIVDKMPADDAAALVDEIAARLQRPPAAAGS